MPRCRPIAEPHETAVAELNESRLLFDLLPEVERGADEAPGEVGIIHHGFAVFTEDFLPELRCLVVATTLLGGGGYERPALQSPASGRADRRPCGRAFPF